MVCILIAKKNKLKTIRNEMEFEAKTYIGLRNSFGLFELDK